MAEELALDHVLVELRAVDDDERQRGAGRAAVNLARDELLARARLAEDQDGRRRLAHLAYELEDLLHRGGVAHDLARRVDLVLDLFLEVGVLGGETLAVERLLDPRLHGAEREGLLDPVEGAYTHGVDGHLGRPVRRHEDHARLRSALAHGAEELDPVEPGHLQVRDEEVVGPLGDASQGGLAVGDTIHLVARGRERLDEDVSLPVVVVRNEDLRHDLASRSNSGPLREVRTLQGGRIVLD